MVVKHVIDGRVKYYRPGQMEYFGRVVTWCVGPDDDSSSIDFHYDSRCASCYLGHSHSRRYHEQNLSELNQ